VIPSNPAFKRRAIVKMSLWDSVLVVQKLRWPSNSRLPLTLDAGLWTLD